MRNNNLSGAADIIEELFKHRGLEDNHNEPQIIMEGMSIYSCRPDP
jgi:hypothetical protein